MDIRARSKGRIGVWRETSRKDRANGNEQSGEDRRARSKAMDLGSIPAGVRRFESCSSHFSGLLND
jgi:hypothetical protein